MEPQSDTLSTAELAFLLLEWEKKHGGLTDSDFKNLLLLATLRAGDAAPINQVLRSGQIQDVHRSVWEALADYNEGKCNKKRGPGVKYSRIQRNILLFLSFCGHERQHGYDKSVEMVMDEYNVGRKSAEKIIADHMKILKASEPSSLLALHNVPKNSAK